VSVSSGASSVLIPPLSPSKNIFWTVQNEGMPGPGEARRAEGSDRESAASHIATRPVEAGVGRPSLGAGRGSRALRVAGAAPAKQAPLEQSPLKLSAAAAAAAASRTVSHQRLRLAVTLEKDHKAKPSCIDVTQTTLSTAALQAQQAQREHRVFRSASRLHFTAGYAAPSSSVPAAARSSVGISCSEEAQRAEMADMAADSCYYRGPCQRQHACDSET
jgi:hypothetical protein